MGDSRDDDEIDVTEDDFDRMFAAGEPVEVSAIEGFARSLQARVPDRWYDESVTSAGILATSGAGVSATGSKAAALWQAGVLSTRE